MWSDTWPVELRGFQNKNFQSMVQKCEVRNGKELCELVRCKVGNTAYILSWAAARVRYCKFVFGFFNVHECLENQSLK